jgi:hypothetical protein
MMNEDRGFDGALLFLPSQSTLPTVEPIFDASAHFVQAATP